MEGKCFWGVEPSVALSLEPSVSAGRGVDVGVGPALLRTVSCGAAVSTRVLVMLGAGDAGGESVEGEFCRGSTLLGGAVCRREGGEGRAEAV
jgi:hypothetical protein